MLKWFDNSPGIISARNIECNEDSFKWVAQVVSPFEVINYQQAGTGLGLAYTKMTKSPVLLV